MAHLMATVEFWTELDRLLTERDRRHEALREADRERVNLAFSAAEKASDRAVAVSNEFRGQLRDQADTFLRKEEALARLDALEHRLDNIASRLDGFEGRNRGMGAVGAGLMQIVTILIALAAVVLGLWHH